MQKTRSTASGVNSKSPAKKYSLSRGKNFSSKGRSFSGRRRTGAGSRRSAKKSVNMDVSNFINKAVPTTGEEIDFVPQNSFSELKIVDILKKNILGRGYKLLTPIQDETIPHILNGEDIVGLANTGTGKTAAFLIPLIDKVSLNKNERVIILTPTRELAIQIEEELRSFVRGMGISSTICVGGTPINRQITSLRKQNHFVIGTPGRVMDLIKREVLKLDTFNTIVLDEADRMLDMGFVNDMRFVMDKMPEKRHTIFFSATMSSNIERLIKDFLNDPINISVKTRATSKNIDQDIVRIGGKDKLHILEKFLSDPEFSKVLVFGRTKYGVEKLSKSLSKLGIKAESIHGNKNHGQRQRSLKKFKNGEIQVLTATDVAARGLDISNVSHVINYELPETFDDYIHRIGRTGRGEKVGKALTFVN
ncbi:MAG: DEAD/DEAH box helicase [Candidatus Pacebacteria bacterium]|nr:DEAD/DEAH box helicase [Candidatus Paceibacterota bacterium]